MNPKTIFELTAAAVDLGKASAAKRGRNPQWPFVPVIDYGPQATGVHTTRTRQITGKAFATRDEAVAYAQRIIDGARAVLAEHLALPGYRALRERYGLPRELADATSSRAVCDCALTEPGPCPECPFSTDRGGEP